MFRLSSATLRVVAGALALTAISVPQYADARPAREAGDYAVSPMRVQKVAAYRFLYLEQKTTFAKMQGPELGATIDKVNEAAGTNATGSVIFSYIGASDDMNAEFTLKIGRPVKADTAAPAGFQVADVAEYKCATLMFSGALSNIGSAYKALYTELFQNGLTPVGDSREFYLYWEGATSENNVVFLQVGVK